MATGENRADGIVVCPESTIESANTRNIQRTHAIEDSSGKNFRCESTLDSAPRRDFIRKAALVTAAAGAGGLLLGKTPLLGNRQALVPESSASVCCTTIAGCTVSARNCLFADSNHLNNGTSVAPGLRFGGGGGEGIASNRACACSNPNVFGLDLYAGGVRRMSITNPCRNSLGIVGINNAAPFRTLCVIGTLGVSCNATIGSVVSGFCVVVDNAGVNSGTCLAPGLRFGGTTSGEGITSNRNPCCLGFKDGLDFYTNSTKRMTITQGGEVQMYNTLNVRACCISFGSVTGVGGFGTGVYGYSNCGTGLFGISNKGIGVQGQSLGPITAEFKNIAVSGDRTVRVKFETGDTTVVDWYAAVAGACNALKVPDGSFYIQHANPSTNPPSIVVNKCGQVGIGTITPGVRLQVAGDILGTAVGVGMSKAPQTTLQVKGGVSFNVAIKTASYTMSTSDFGILANASTAALTITLPPASKAGMLVHIKKIDSNKAHAVTVSRSGTDTIEGATTKALTAQYQSVTLLAGGNGVWYIQANAT
jgi:hypothetical protein